MLTRFYETLFTVSAIHFNNDSGQKKDPDTMIVPRSFGSLEFYIVTFAFVQAYEHPKGSKD